MGAEPIIEHDLATTRQLVKESGYDGRPVGVLHPTVKAAWAEAYSAPAAAMQQT